MMASTSRLASACTRSCSRACSNKAWRTIDAPWVKRTSDGSGSLFVNWFPLEKANEHWIKDLQSCALGLHQSVLASTKKHELPCFANRAGTFEVNGQYDAYFVLHQLKHEDNADRLAQVWRLAETQLLYAVVFALRTRNAQAHNLKGEIDKNWKSRIHNKATVRKLYKSLQTLLGAAATHGETHGDHDGRTEAQASLSELESRYELYRARETEFWPRVSEKVEAVRRGDLEVKLVHEQPHLRLKWPQLAPDIQQLLLDDEEMSKARRTLHARQEQGTS